MLFYVSLIMKSCFCK